MAPVPPGLPDGIVAVVKRDCPTCVLVGPVLAELESAGVELTVYTQDDPGFPENVHNRADDTELRVSYHHNIDTVPTLIRAAGGVELERIEGWSRPAWESFTGVTGLGTDLPEWRPGCGSLSVDPAIADRLRVIFEGGVLQSRRVDFASLEDFLSGTLSGGRSAQGDSRRGTSQNSHALYLQDGFRWRHNLTINAGVRYDYYGVISEEAGRFSNFDPAIGLVPIGTGGFDRLYHRDFNNFSPRIGVAWDVSGKGKTVMRAGWGLYYDAFSQDFFVGQLPFNTFNPGPAYNPIGSAPILFSFSTVDQIRPGQAIFTDYLDSDVFSIDRKSRTPYVQNYNLNVQHELLKNVVLQVGYVGSKGTKLFRYRDINQPVNPAVSTARPFDNGPFAPSGGTFFYVNQLETTANSSYNALQTSVSLREHHGFSSAINYTWSHSIDNASDGQDYVANATQPDNSHRVDQERASSNFDNRHRFVATFSYDLPNLWKRFPRWCKGWQINGIVTVRSGSPFHLVLFDDYNGTGEFFPRPDIVGDPFAGTHGPDNFLNLAAFQVPCTLDPSGDGSAGSCRAGTQHFGSLGRNALVGPGYRNFDFSIFKTTGITEQVKVQIRAEIFNIFNHPNFASPLLPGFSADASFNGIDPVTGRGQGFLPITVTPDVGIGNPFLGCGGSRNIQLAVRFTF